MEKPSWTYRALEIILGLVALIMGSLILLFPTIIAVTLIVFFGIALLIIGILRVSTAYSRQLPNLTRTDNIAIGIIIAIIGVIILIFPTFSLISLIVLIGIGIFIYGIGRTITGGLTHDLSGGFRGALIVLGILIAIFGLLVIFFPLIGILTKAVFVSLGLLVIGIDSLVAGFSGTPTRVRRR